MSMKRLVGSCAVGLMLAMASLGAAGSDVADAAMAGDTAAVRALLAQHADVNAVQADGATALHWAVYREDLETANLLIRAGANVKAANREGFTPLALACINGHAGLIETLLKAGADANERLLNGETPLMMASRTGNVAAMTVLLDHGADVNAKEALRGTTPLMWAAAEGHPDAIQLLIERGADLGARSNPDYRFRDRRVLARRLQIAEIRRHVVDGKETRERPRAGQPDSRTAGLCQIGVAVALTPLVFAARRNDLDSVRILLAAGADVNQVTEYGWTPLLVATQNRYYQLGSFLLDKGADPNIANKGGWTPLYLAVDNRNIEGGDYPVRKGDMDHLDFIKKLLDHGADVNARMRDNTETSNGLQRPMGGRERRDGVLAGLPVERPRRDAVVAGARRRSEDRDEDQRHRVAGRGGHRLGGGHHLRVVGAGQRRSREAVAGSGHRPEYPGRNRAHRAARRRPQGTDGRHSAPGGPRRQAGYQGLRMTGTDAGGRL